MTSSNDRHDQPTLAGNRTREIALQFPELLNADDLEQIEPRVERLIQSIDVLREVPLDNADEPAPVFRPIGKEQL